MKVKYDLSEIKKRLYISVLNYEDNVDLLENVPFIKKGNFALVPKICIGEKSTDGIYESSVLITNELMLNMNIDIDTLMETAKENSKNIFPGKVRNLADYMSDKDLTPDGVAIPQVYVVTNNIGYNGASAIFYQPDLIANLAKMIDKDLMLFPIDDNLMLCMPITGGIKQDDMQNMYAEALSDIDKPLSLSLLRYNNDSRLIEQLDGSTYSLEND